MPLSPHFFPGPESGAPAAVVRACRHCGCTEAAACPGGCYWVSLDECSACVVDQAEGDYPDVRPALELRPEWRKVLGLIEKEMQAEEAAAKKKGRRRAHK